MIKDKLYIGIDTSCYTTSISAIVNKNVFHYRKNLIVKSGECGLRQADALFQHLNNMPVLFENLASELQIRKFDDVIITVSSRPRNVQGSYMPVFLAGKNYGKTIASILGAKYNEVSHQDGHIMAAIYSCGNYDILSKPFLTYHISGGTTELLLTEFIGDEFSVEIVGGTLDLPAGQFIDRIGVLAEMEFPCGKYLDNSACNFKGDFKVKTCVNNAYINFSGEETRYRRLLEQGEDREKIFYLVMKCIAESIKKSIEFAMDTYNIENVLMVGGVSSSNFIREALRGIPKIYFAKPEFSTDNAVGVCNMGILIDGGV